MSRAEPEPNWLPIDKSYKRCPYGRLEPISDPVKE